MTYRAIVVGTDGSETAGRAVSKAIEFAKIDSARLVIVTAFERHDETASVGTPAELEWMITDASTADSHARGGRDEAVRAGVTDVVVQAIEGPPADKLLEAAEDFNAGLIVVGSVGLTGGARFILGSVASSVLHHAPCDVLVVHTH